MKKIDFSELKDDEIELLLGIVNVLYPTPEIEYTSDNLHWLKEEAFVKKIVTAQESVIEEHKPIYISLKEKLQIKS
jgi:hypothetical protein